MRRQISDYLTIPVAIMVGCYHGFSFSGEMVLLEEMVRELSLSGSDTSIVAMFSLLAEMLPIFFLQMIYGIKVYKRLCVASIYVFSRTDNKGLWMKNEIFALTKELILFPITEVAVCCSVILLTGGHIVISEIKALLCFVFIYGLYLSFTATLINGISTKIGSDYGFSLFFVVQALLITVVFLSERIQLPNSIMCFNPIAWLLADYELDLLEYKATIKLYSDGIMFGISPRYSIPALLVLNLAGYLVLKRIVIKHEFLVDNIEDGGN